MYHNVSSDTLYLHADRVTDALTTAPHADPTPNPNTKQTLTRMAGWFENYGLTETSVLLILLCVRALFRSLSTRQKSAVQVGLPAGVISQLALDDRAGKLFVHTASTIDPARATHAIVLLHGFGQSSNAWRQTAADVAAAQPTAVVLVPDLVGFGKSSSACASLPLSQPLFVEHVEYVIRTAQCSHLPLIIAGMSMGGGAALAVNRILRTRGLRIAQLVLCCPAGVENRLCNWLTVTLAVARTLFLPQIWGMLLRGVALCLPKFKRLVRWLPLLATAPTYDLDAGIFNSFDDIAVHLVWGDADQCHEHWIASLYRKHAKHLHIHTIAGWGHAQTCHKLHEVRVGLSSIGRMLGLACSTVWRWFGLLQLKLAQYRDMWSLPDLTAPSTEVVFDPKTGRTLVLPSPVPPVERKDTKKTV